MTNGFQNLAHLFFIFFYFSLAAQNPPASIAERQVIKDRLTSLNGRELTFGDIVGRQLKSRGEVKFPHPYQRVLSFQYRRALAKAKSEKWEEPVTPHPSIIRTGGGSAGSWVDRVDYFFDSIVEEEL